MFPSDLPRVAPAMSREASHSQERAERPELADSWFNHPVRASRTASSRPPPPHPIDDPVADAWFV